MMMLRALVFTVALAPVHADCPTCTKDVYLKVKSCGAFWTPSKYVGEWAEGTSFYDGGCHKDVCCADKKMDCCENDVGAILAFTFGLLGVVLCCGLGCVCSLGCACGPALKRGGRYVVLGFLAFLCALMQCIALLRGPLWAYVQFKYKYAEGDPNALSGGSWSDDYQYKYGFTETNDLWFVDVYDGDFLRMHHKDIVKEDAAHHCNWDKPGANKKCKRLIQAIITARYTTGFASLLMLSCAVIMLSVACGCRFRCCCDSWPDDATERTFMILAGLLSVGGLIGLAGASNFSSEHSAVTEDWERYWSGRDGVDGDDYYSRRWDTDMEADEVVSCHWGCAFSILSGLFSILVAGATLYLGKLRPLQQDPQDDKPLLAAGETENGPPALAPIVSKENTV